MVVNVPTSWGAKMPDISALLQLPFEVIWMLGIGYLGYKLTFVGRDAHHQVLDRIFLIFVIGSFSRWGATYAHHWVEMPASIEAFVALGIGVTISLIWRRWLGGLFFEAMHKTKFIRDDGQPDVWRSMLARELRGPRRLVVKLKNGNSLMCSELADFNDAPLGPCLFGPDGSIAMYVTDVLKADEENWVQIEPIPPDMPEWGYEMSFIPAAEIARIDVTRPL